MHKIKIVATLNEGIDSEGVGFPESVTVEGGHMLMASALCDIAQDVVDGYFGSTMSDHSYFPFFNSSSLAQICSEDRGSIVVPIKNAKSL